PAPFRAASDRVVIGWTGSSTSQAHLEEFAPVLRRLLRQRDVELRVISDRPPRLPGIPCTWRRWSAASEVAELQQLDIGIMPMPDDEWSQGKCGMKLLLYMALGIPAVCSPVGTNNEIVVPGSNGLFATTEEEWLTAIGTLLDSPAYRTQ